MAEENTESNDKSKPRKFSNDSYKSVIGSISELNKSATILASQSNVLQKGLAGASLNDLFKGFNQQYSSMQDIYKQLPDVSKMLNPPPFIAATREANKTIAAITGGLSTPHKFAKAISEQVKTTTELHKTSATLSNPISSSLKLESSLKALSGFNTIDKTILAQFAASANMGRIAELSLHAERNFTGFDWGQLAQKINIDHAQRTLLSQSLIDYTTHFSKFWKTINSNPKSFEGLNPIFLRIPPVEFYNTSNVVEKISFDNIDDVEEEILNNDILIENEETLHSLLPKLNKDLVNLWIGANQALVSNNIDKVRHFTTSIRELFTHIIHLLAPDDKVKKWTQKPDEHLYDGRPTRKARLLYITRGIHNQHLDSFINKDVEATLKFIDLLNEGTHSIKPKLIDRQLIAVKCKAESMLKYLLQIHFADEL